MFRLERAIIRLICKNITRKEVDFIAELIVGVRTLCEIVVKALPGRNM